MKRCPKCGLEKDESGFYNDRRLPSGLSCWCKQCDREKRREYKSRPGVAAALKAQGLEYRSRPEIKERLRERDKAYREAHPEKGRDRSIKYYYRHTDRVRGYYVKNREKRMAANKKSRLWRLYGLSQEQIVMMLKEQGNRCKICGADTPGKTYKNWCIDHDHRTGKVRGLLCRACNVGLGHFKESREILMKAISYLEESQVAFEFEKGVINA